MLWRYLLACAAMARARLSFRTRPLRTKLGITVASLLNRVKHLQLRNAVVDAAEQPTKLAADILQHHHLRVDVDAPLDQH